MTGSVAPPAARLLALAALSCLSLLAYVSASSAATPATHYRTIRVDAPEPQVEGRWGERTRTLSDLTGDGVSEILVSTPRHDVAGLTNTGRAWIINGATRSLVRVIDSPEIQANANFGFWIDVLGDLTGDGKDDFVVGTDAQDVGANVDQGKAWVYNGATGGVLYALDNPSPQREARFGARIGRAGDLTGDGRSEVLVGATNHDLPPGCAFGSPVPFPAGCRENEGQAFIFNGATGALYRTLNMPDPVLPTCDERFVTPTEGCGRFGYSPQTPGDTDGDRVPDQLVDAGTWNQARGRLYLFSGSSAQPAGTPSVPRLRIDDPEPERGPQPGVWFGFQDAEAFAPGDVNGDGHADIYGGAYEEAVPLTQAEGRGYVFNGLTGALLYPLRDPTPHPSGQFGWSLARTDFNKDGRPDLYIGAAPHNVGSADQGTYVFDGRNGAPLKAFELPGSDVQAFEPGPPRDIGPSLGWTVSAPGDLNRDGEPDYVAGAPFLNAGATRDQGGLYIFLSQVPRRAEPSPEGPPSPGLAPFAGCPALSANVIRGSVAGGSITGTVRGDRIFGGTGNDVVDGLAGDDCIDLGTGTDRGQGGLGNDLMLGGLGDDRMDGSSGNDGMRGGPNADRVNGGLGNDRLHGQSGNDRVSGSRGRDRVNGGSGRDSISAGSSDDRVAGDQGNDRINGNSGEDVLKGNSGNDRITGSSGFDRIAGGPGNDRMSSRDGRRDRVDCGRGRDRVVADPVDVIARNCERVSRRG